ncbi:hypothetical protein F5X96DRAFT_672429 [Biscogniauxia mediterranea]|nr:hypothetical protein F5X96DRAFT_672429 [Biscogniauxia mediterranea]
MCVIVYTAQYCTYAAHSVPSTRRELRRSACAELRRDPTLSWGQCPLGAPAEGPTLPGGPVDMCEACCRARREPNKTDADTGDTSTDTDKHGAASGDSSDKEKVKDKEKEKDKGKEKEKMAEGGGAEHVGVQIKDFSGNLNIF